MNSIGTILLTTLDTKFKEVKVVRENMIGITTSLLTPMHLTGAKNMASAQRYFTFIWYLNDVPGPGGYTEFYDELKFNQKKVR